MLCCFSFKLNTDSLLLWISHFLADFFFLLFETDLDPESHPDQLSEHGGPEKTDISQHYSIRYFPEHFLFDNVSIWFINKVSVLLCSVLTEQSPFDTEVGFVSRVFGRVPF